MKQQAGRIEHIQTIMLSMENDTGTKIAVSFNIL
jgi:hypothetical protein